ncbi:MAG: type II secretion system F family protein [Crenarchaeota archaeon]|nr:type II secretion system F family protein [Thermoproteota archaeon]
MRIVTFRRVGIAVALFTVIGILLPTMGYSELAKLAGVKVPTGIRFEAYVFGPLVLVLPVSPQSIVLVSCLVVGVASAIYVFTRAKFHYFEAMREELMQLISSVAAMVRTRVPLIDALEEASGIVGEPLRSAVLEFTSLVRLGEDPHVAMRKVFGKAPPEVRLLASSFVIAMQSGGRVPEVLSEANRYVQQLQRMDFIRRYRLAEQRLIALMAVLAFAASGAVIVWLIEYVAPKLASLPGAASINIPFVTSSYFVSALFMDIMASLVVSRIMTGTFYLAPKYVALTVPLIALMFLALMMGLIHIF